MALLEFYGDTCPHCIDMKPMVAKVEKKVKVKFEKLEVWNNDVNAERLGEIDRGLCGGVPFFYNTESKHFICGSCDEDSLVALAKGRKP